MPEVACNGTIPIGRGRHGRGRPLLVVTLLLLTLLPACSQEQEESDPLIDWVHTARAIRFDSGTPHELLLRGDSLREFLDRFERDTFRPGPRSVRIESDCRPGSITIGRGDYPIALCTVWGGAKRPVLQIGLDTAVLRMIDGG